MSLEIFIFKIMPYKVYVTKSFLTEQQKAQFLEKEWGSKGNLRRGNYPNVLIFCGIKYHFSNSGDYLSFKRK